MLSEISKEVSPDHNTLLAELQEPTNHEVVDGVMESRSGSVLRRPVADVEAEIAAAEKAQRKARREARKELRHEREEQHKEKIHAKVAELKSKVRHEHTEKVPAGTGS